MTNARDERGLSKPGAIRAYVSLCLVTVVISWIGAALAPYLHIGLVRTVAPGTEDRDPLPRRYHDLRAHMIESGQTDSNVISKAWDEGWKDTRSKLRERSQNYPSEPLAVNAWWGAILGLVAAVFWGRSMQRRLEQGQRPSGVGRGVLIGCIATLLLHLPLSMWLAHVFHGLPVLPFNMSNPPFWTLFAKTLTRGLMFGLPISIVAGAINGAVFGWVWYRIWPPTDKSNRTTNEMPEPEDVT